MIATETHAGLSTSDGPGLTLLDLDAHARAEGPMLDVRLRQRYCNRSDANVEAVYTFPLPQGAVLLGLEFRLGGRRLAGVVAARREAERRYEQALDDGDSAVLLEKVAEGLYTVSVGNLMAGEEATVELRYAQLLSFVQDSVRIAIPTVVAPRYGDPLAAGLPHHAVPEVDVTADHPARFTIELHGELADGELACPSHRAQVERRPGHATVRLRGALDRDFVVTVGGLQARPLARLARDGDGWVALASFLPPAPSAPPARRGLRVKLLVDCSGSMAGDSIGQARRAVARLLDRLGEADRIDLSRFGSTVQHFYVMEAASPAHLARCHRWARELQADLGGTELLAALREVFGRDDASDEGADVFLITDGEVHDADAIVALAQRHRQRVFAVGVGSAPNESLLQRLAARTGGAAELVTPNESVEDALMRLFARLRQPRITGLSVDWPAMPDWAAPLPAALWAGETAHVLARFAAQPAGAATLRWTDGGSAHTLALPLPLAADADSPATDGARSTPAEGPADAPPVEDALPIDDALPRLAAGLAIEALPEAQRGAFAERYQLVTEFTSMALVMLRDDDARAHGLPAHLKVAQMLAAGWGGQGSVLVQSACYQAAPDAYLSVAQPARADDFTVLRHPASAAASLRAALTPSDPSGIDALAVEIAQLLAPAARRPRSGAPGATLDAMRPLLEVDALRPLLPPGLEQALEHALRSLGTSGPGEAELIAWLVVELARRCPDAGFPRAMLRELRMLSRGIVAPQTLVDALDVLASRPGTAGPGPIPAFLRSSG